MLLSNRMRAVVNLVQPCNVVADIGCDHGYVAIELVKSNICKRVVAMDVNKGPLERARLHIEENQLSDQIQTRLSNGTKALQAGEADGIICAGMGGRLVISILEDGMGIVRHMKQIILQPQSEIGEVRRYLRLHGFETCAEDMVFEDGKYYPMMRVRYSGIIDESDCETNRIYDMYGEKLLKASHPVLCNFLIWQKKSVSDIRENLNKQEDANKRQLDRIEELDRQHNIIEFCLNKYYEQ